MKIISLESVRVRFDDVGGRGRLWACRLRPLPYGRGSDWYHRSCATVAGFVIAIALMTVGPSGCAESLNGASMIDSKGSPIPVSDRLKGHYAELSDGQFAIIADFEDPTQIEMMRVEPAGNELRIRKAGGVRATGGGALVAGFQSAHDRLIADNTHARRWLLPVDWRPYDLLMMNVFAPRGVGRLQVTLVAGEDDRRQEAATELTLAAGWNLLKIDLDEASKHVVLDDVRQMRVSMPDISAKTAIRIDDILLTRSQQPIYGSEDDQEGRMYVVRRGRRIHVGSCGRFELAFLDGRIVRWYPLDGRSDRRRELVGSAAALGPMPVSINALTASASGEPSSAASTTVEPNRMMTRQRVSEAGPMRVVVEGEWLLPTPGSQRGRRSDPPKSRLGLRWTYVVYPTGDIYVTVRSESPNGSVGAQGMTWLRSLGADGQMGVHSAGDDTGPADLRDAAYAWITDSGAAAGLVVAMDSSGKSTTIHAQRDEQTRQISLIERNAEPQEGRAPFHCLMNVWPAGNCRSVLREALVSTYCHRMTPEFLAGDLDRTTAGDEDGDGFNERSGAWMLALEDNRLQFNLDGTTSPICRPVFCVANSAGLDAWVYHDQVVCNDVGRDANGNLLFQFEQILDGPSQVEIYARTRQRVADAR